MKTETILSPADIGLLDQRDLSGAYCVVFDVLRATSSIVTAFEHGAAAVLPVRTIPEAEAAAAAAAAAGKRRILLAGERGGDRIGGFDLGNSPGEFTGCDGCLIITTTTNGTVALQACANASRTAAACLLNLSAVADDIQRTQPVRLVLVCAGTHERVALEDVFAAGRLLSLLGINPAGDDASALALMLAETFADNPLAALALAENGRTLAAANRASDIAWAARESAFLSLPLMHPDGWLRLATPNA